MKEDQKVFGDLTLEICGENLDKVLREENIREVEAIIVTDSGIAYRLKAIGHQLNWEIA